MLPLTLPKTKLQTQATLPARRCVAALLTLILVTLWLPAGLPMLRGVDAAVYCQVAKEITLRPAAHWATVTLGGAPFYEHPPGFMYVLASFFSAFGATTATAIAVAQGLMTLLVLLTAHIAWLAAGPSAAVGTLLSLCLQSGFWNEAHNPMLELPTCAGLAAGVWGLILGRGPGLRRRSIGLLAAILGPSFACCSKGPVGLLSIALAAAVAWAGLCSWRRAACTTVMSLAATTLLALGFEEARKQAGLDTFLAQYWAHQLWPSMVQGRHHAVASFTFYGPVLWRWYGCGLCLVPAAAFNAWRARHRHDTQSLCLLIIAAIWIACVVLGFSLMRQKYQWYMHSALPGFALLGGAWMMLCSQRMQRAITTAATGLAAAAVVGFICLRITAPQALAATPPVCLGELYRALPTTQDVADGLHIPACCDTQSAWRDRHVALFLYGTEKFRCHTSKP